MNIRRFPRRPLRLALGLALAASVGLSGCAEEPETTEPPVADPAALEADPAATSEMPGDVAGPLEGGSPPLDDGLGDYAGPTALDVTSLALGSEAGPDDTIAMPTDTFSADDDIVVAIDSDGAASNAEIAARLVDAEGRLVGEQAETVTTTGADTTVITFDNTGAWPAGEYTVEIWVDGTRAESTELTVE